MIDAVDMVIVSAVSLYEIGQKLRAGKWPEMEPYRHELIPVVARMGGQVAVVDGQIAEIAATLDWPHRDPFDRIIAATSILTGHRLISADPAFSTLKDARFVPTFW